VSVEQALSMSYATSRFVQLGWRVIRVEATPAGSRKPGDPNRYIGREVAGPDRHSYYVAPNVAKEAIALDLKSDEGRTLLRSLVRELGADVFCTNTLPVRHRALGMDPETLRADRPGLVWCCISALGLAHPEVPGYDPVIQALAGYMDLTGDPEGPPTQCGPPIIDLKAGDEAFAQVLHALLERERTGVGAVIDISMLRCAVSWLLTFLPMLDMQSPPSELRRSGNQHRQFIPTNNYPTADGFIYMAVGSDAQWQRLVAEPLFASLAEAEYATNEGRRAAKDELHRRIGEITRAHASADVASALARAAIPHAPITPIERVLEIPELLPSLLRTRLPGGAPVRLPPAAVDTAHLASIQNQLPLAPSYGEHTDSVLQEIGIEPARITELRQRGIVG
jgi:itaconate CoA-transferase